MTILWPPFVGWMFFCSLLFRILSRTRVPILIMAIPGIDKRIAEYNKKVAKKSVSDFEENSERKVALPLKKTLSTANEDESTESEYFED